MTLLKIEDLHASTQGTSILKGINLNINPGEVHAVMGPNGSGKSTLSKVIAADPDYVVDKGKILYEINFKLKDITQMEPDLRAREGIFLAFQYPIEVPGVSNSEFLRAAFNAVVSHQGGEELDPFDFARFAEEKLEFLNMKKSFLDRQVNVDFSGGEKKRNEILQLAVLSPRLAILDECDSGLDVDSLRMVADGINKLRSQERSFILITHYQRLLDYVVPDFVHILHDGKIVKSGDKELAMQVEKHGYDGILN